MDCVHRDGYKLIMQGLATIVRIAQSDELKYALDAGEWLVAYGENLLREKQQAKLQGKPAFHTTSRDQIIAELRGLYAKALGEAPLVVEAEAETVEDPPRPRDRS